MGSISSLLFSLDTCLLSQYHAPHILFISWKEFNKRIYFMFFSVHQSQFTTLMKSMCSHSASYDSEMLQMMFKWSLVCGGGLSYVWLFATPSTVAHEVLPSMEFSRQEYWSGLPLLSPRHLPDAWIEPASPVSLALQADSLPVSWAINLLSSVVMFLSWILPKSNLIVNLIQNFKNGSIIMLLKRTQLYPIRLQCINLSPL